MSKSSLFRRDTDRICKLDIGISMDRAVISAALVYQQLASTGDLLVAQQALACTHVSDLHMYAFIQSFDSVLLKVA